jgi:hypothetical protein
VPTRSGGPHSPGCSEAEALPPLSSVESQLKFGSFNESDTFRLTHNCPFAASKCGTKLEDGVPVEDPADNDVTGARTLRSREDNEILSVSRRGMTATHRSFGHEVALIADFSAGRDEVNCHVSG